MARNFRIDVGLLAGGSLVGSWDRDFPTSVIGCSVQQCAEALLFNDTNRIFQQSGAGTYSAKFFMGNITLSGGNPEDGVYPSINNLPPGIIPITAVPQLTPSHPGGDAGYSFSILALGSGVSGITPTSNVTIFYTYTTVPSMFQLATEVIGGSVTHPASYGAIKGVFITGTYIIDLTVTRFLLQNPLIPINVGNKINILANGAFAGVGSNSLVGVQQILLSYTYNGVAQTIIVDSSYIIIQSPTQLEFYLPIGFGFFSGTVTITLIGDGVQFSGSVVVGTLQVLFEDASGIYQLASGQIHDALYFRAGYTTIPKLLEFPNILDDETYYRDEDFFNLLPYPTKILAQSFLDEEDYEQEDYSIIATLITPVVIQNVEIPSPFIKTAFLP